MNKVMNLLSKIKDYAKHHKKISGVVVLVLVVLVYFGYRSTQQPTAPTASNMAEAVVTRGPIQVTVTGTGTVVPVDEQEAAPNVTGTVEKLYVKNGDQVKKGQIIAELTNDSLQLQMEKAKLDVEKAKLALNDSSSQLTSDTITAPFAGRIVNLQAKTGDDVSKNSVLATLQDDSQLVFDMPVDQNTVTKVVKNQTVEVFMPDRGDTVEGKVISINNQAVSGYNGSGRSYIKVAIASKGTLAPGMKAFGTITINGKPVDALAVSTLEWIGEKQLQATLSGKVTAASVQEGQVVKAGQNLFKLDSDANASQQAAQQISYEQAQLSLQDLQNQVQDLTVKAPFDGVISGLDAKVGDEVAGGGSKASGGQNATSTATVSSTKTLGQIINSQQMEVSFPVDEVDIAKVKSGQTATVSLDALPNQKFQGTVTDIAEQGTVTNNVSSFDVTITLNNPDRLVKAGMTANVTIVAAEKTDALLIPIEALQDRGNRKFVILPSTSDQQQRNIQPVEVGLTNESYAEITNGLKEGEKIMVTGVQAASANSNNRFPGFSGMGSRSFGGGGRSSGSGGSRTGGSGGRD